MFFSLLIQIAAPWLFGNIAKEINDVKPHETFLSPYVNLTFPADLRMVTGYWVAPCQGVPTLSRKRIVKSITPCGASQIFLSIRVALDFVVPTNLVAGRSVLFKTKYCLFCGRCWQQTTYLFLPFAFSCGTGFIFGSPEIYPAFFHS